MPVTYIYGPVKSWRSGTSLGIDPIGETSTCSFNCAYCQLGQIQKRTAEIKTYVPTEQILNDFSQAIENKDFDLKDLDVITFAGSGEPTLAENLAEIIDGLREIMSGEGVQVPISILTNATLFNDDEVCRRALKADLISLKLDAPNDEILRSINQPVEGVTIESIISGIKNLQRLQCELGDCHDSQSESRNDGGVSLRALAKQSPSTILQMQIMLMPKFLDMSLRGSGTTEAIHAQESARSGAWIASLDSLSPPRNDTYITQLAKIVKDLGVKKIQINTPTRPKPVSKTGEYWIETRGNHPPSPGYGATSQPDYVEFKELPVIDKETAFKVEEKFREIINDPKLEIINVYSN